MPKTGSRPQDSSAIWGALARRYAAPQFALLAQVGNGTGYGVNRWADALAMSLWPSRGLHLHGFEIKVYRNDWLRELKNPAKAEAIAPYCDFWWIATIPDVVHLDELPPTWGLLEVKRRSLWQVKAAIQNPQTIPLDTAMIAAILRRASEHLVPRDSINDLIEHARAEAFERGKNSGDSGALKSAERERDECRDAIRNFQAASGVEIARWNGGDVGRRFKAATEIDGLRQGWQLNQIEHQINHMLVAVKALREIASGSRPEGTDQP